MQLKPTKLSMVYMDPENLRTPKGSPEIWRVMFEGQICTSDFNCQGAASAYLKALEAGTRKPEYRK